MACLGTDNSGSKYWFAARRLVVAGADGEVHYYSSKDKVDELLVFLNRTDKEVTKVE